MRDDEIPPGASAIQRALHNREEVCDISCMRLPMPRNLLGNITFREKHMTLHV
jgi:hypothetical protein